jgi:hypothetical protein
MKTLKYFLPIWLALAVLLFIFRDHLPSLFSSKPASESEQSADVDMPIVVRVKGGMLEVASIKGKRHFSGASDPTIFGNALPFCREQAGWNAAYKIIYRVRLGEKWEIRYKDKKLFARVPELQPSLPVAIDTNTLSFTGQNKCWFMMDLGTRERVLRRISRDLEKLAHQSASKDFARQAARETVTEFLRTWAFNQKEYPNVDPDTPIKLVFSGDR